MCAVLDVELSKQGELTNLGGAIFDYGGISVAVTAMSSDWLTICECGCTILFHIVYFYRYFSPKCDALYIRTYTRLLRDAGAFRALIDALERFPPDEALTERILHVVRVILGGIQNLSATNMSIFIDPTYTFPTYLLHAMLRYPSNKDICDSGCTIIHSICNDNAQMKRLLMNWRPTRDSSSTWRVVVDITSRDLPSVDDILLRVLSRHPDLQAVGLMAIYAIIFNKNKLYLHYYRQFEHSSIGRIIRDAKDFGYLPQYPLYKFVAELDENGAQILQHLCQAYSSFTLAPLECRPVDEYRPADQHPAPDQHVPADPVLASILTNPAHLKHRALTRDLKNVIASISKEFGVYKSRLRFDLARKSGVPVAFDEQVRLMLQMPPVRDAEALIKGLTRRLGAYTMRRDSGMDEAEQSARARDFEAFTAAMTREFSTHQQCQRDTYTAAYDAHRALTCEMRAVISAISRQFSTYQQRLTAFSEEYDNVRDDFVALRSGLTAEIAAHNKRGTASREQALLRDFEALIITMTREASAYQLPRGI